MSEDHVYMTLVEEHGGDGARWAFGTGFEDPLYGIDTTVPTGVDTAQLAACCLALGDDALVLAQRLAQWCTCAPELEIEVGLANLGLDLLGQARMLYTRAGQVDGSGRGEDSYAYFRDPAEFRNVLLAELPNGDFAFSIARLLILSSWRLALFAQLAESPDPVLAAIAAKGVKELTYHREFAAEWALRLGDGTDESHGRMQAGLDETAEHLAELLMRGGDFGLDATSVRANVEAVLRQVADTAGLTLRLPTANTAPATACGRDGEHTDHLAPLLAELQSEARADPEASW
ncbi:1,2-phenylacetyl-CoA epoxidase subunit PaaC [Actinospica sp.]|uniref:1,2-phenylacetyl-CoA epoxidase subunit PaaC n=1 Tax=Actinospica sp. TaxID=1872142 RepID=UPI002CEEACB8|nr:1,2-phenylacetyl-CoA epoxidase subunit PaaC [Actinospica sp.]HWG26381.1 1,2-phenylacetyl-CoA epoxidase subunit PaaC [Actinospica sp.]